MMTTRSRLIVALSSPSPQVVLNNLSVKALAFPEMEEALQRYQVPAFVLQEKVQVDSNIILAQVSPEYRRYEAARYEANRSLSRFDNVSAWLLAAVTGYLAIPPRPIDQTSVIVATALLLLVALRFKWISARHANLASLVSNTRQRWLDTLQDTALLPYIRNELTSRAQSFDPFSSRLIHQFAPGLSERHEPKHLVTSEAMKNVDAIVEGMSAGSLGISGRRGIGKSTMINAYCSTRYDRRKDMPELRVLVSAPVDYDARDFILHVFSRLCEVVLDQESIDNIAQPERQIGQLADSRSVIGLVGIVGGALILAFTLLSGQAAIRLSLAVLAIAGIVMGTILTTGWRFDRMRTLSGATRKHPSTMRSRTLAQLSQLQFLQKLTTASSVSINFTVPVAAQAGLSTSRELAEQPLSLPQLVSRYVDFATDVATWWRARHEGTGRLVIGIDEVDRIRDSGRAEDFLGDIKAIFEIPYCFYLVSLSDDAVKSYDGRALTVRAAFDNAFDEIIPVGPLTFNESAELLAKRIIGLPRPFVALCYILSGGLPRDLIRAARTLVETSKRLDESTLPALASALVRHELSTVKKSCLSQLSELTDDSEILERLNNRRWPSNSTKSIWAAGEELWRWQQTCVDPGDSAVIRGLSVSCSFYGAVLSFFGTDTSTLRAKIVSWHAEGPGTLQALAEARHAMVVNLHLARKLLQQCYGQGAPTVHLFPKGIDLYR